MHLTLVLVYNLGNFLGEFQNSFLFKEGRERLKGEAGHSRFAGGNFNKQGSLQTRLVLGGNTMSRSPCPPCRILKFIETS